jgi:hypothetical protein
MPVFSGGRGAGQFGGVRRWSIWALDEQAIEQTHHDGDVYEFVITPLTHKYLVDAMTR